MAEELLGIYESQHAELGRHLLDARRRKRPAIGTQRKARRSLRVVRVMNTGSRFPMYDSRESRSVVYFQLSQSTRQSALIFSGDRLTGHIVLTVGSVTITISVHATTDELRQALGFRLTDCRATVFPGLWEFAFGGLYAANGLPVSAIAKEGFTPLFEGGLFVVQEGWRSVSKDGSTPSTVEVIDGIPFLEGELRLGAMALASPLSDGLWVTGCWSCAGFTYLPGASSGSGGSGDDEDEEEEEGGSGGGGPEGPEEPPPPEGP